MHVKLHSDQIRQKAAAVTVPLPNQTPGQSTSCPGPLTLSITQIWTSERMSLRTAKRPRSLAHCIGARRFKYMFYFLATKQKRLLDASCNGKKQSPEVYLSIQLQVTRLLNYLLAETKLKNLCFCRTLPHQGAHCMSKTLRYVMLSLPIKSV